MTKKNDNDKIIINIQKVGKVVRKELKKLIKILIMFVIISTFGVYAYAENLEAPNTEDNVVENTESGNNQEEGTGNTEEPAPEKPEENNTEETPKENENTNSGNNSNNTSQTATKSSDASLSNLGINPHDFSGFTPSNTVYNVLVPEETKSIEIYAQVANSKASVTGTGTKSLEIGKNAFVLVVTAEDGTKKTYTINVTRNNENVDEGNETESNDVITNTNESLEVIGGKEGLKALNIEGAELSPNFKANIYEYTIKYESNSESLKIDFEPAVSTYIVEIMGNNNLVQGDNVISIFVSDESGNNIATYQIVIDKYLVLETETTNTSMYIWIGIVVFLILLILIGIITKIINRKKIKEHLKNKDEENVNISQHVDELPKGLAKKDSEIKKTLLEKINDEGLEEKENVISQLEKEKQIARNQFLDEYEAKLNDEEKI